MPSSLNTENQIKTWAQEMGFLACGFAKAERLNDHEAQLDQWLANGFHGNMGYMENHKAMRLDPTLLVTGAKSVICLAYNYFPETTPLHPNSATPQIAKYAWGDDYHHVIKDKLFKLIDRIKTLNPAFEARAFVDSAPVMERQWAERAGLGWIGKNSLLLRKGVGSFFFLAEIICNIELSPDQPQTDHCGECTACIDACPTQAIVQPQVIDSTRCISYLTIEDKTWPKDNEAIQNISKTGVVVTTDDVQTQGSIESTAPPINTGTWAYGCDVCQDVCPWNRFSKPHNEPQFQPRELIFWDAERWNQASEEPARIKNQLKKSAMQRAGHKKILSQANAALDFIKTHKPS
jgi:epoxyqueuosine reductase